VTPKYHLSRCSQNLAAIIQYLPFDVKVVLVEFLEATKDGVYIALET